MHLLYICINMMISTTQFTLHILNALLCYFYAFQYEQTISHVCVKNSNASMSSLYCRLNMYGTGWWLRELNQTSIYVQHVAEN